MPQPCFRCGAQQLSGVPCHNLSPESLLCLPEVFWLLCCVSCSAPSTEGQSFPKVKSSSHCWPQVWDHGSGCREQPPSCAGPRLHHWEGRWEHSCHLPPPCSSGADPALPVAPTQQGSSTTHQWGCSPSSGHSGF